MNSEQRVSKCQTSDGQAIKVIALEQEEENEFAGEEVVVVKNGEKKATSGQEAQTETATSKFDYEKLKGLMIDVVNPKFKSFNRPLFLALVVGMLTFASFIALCVYLQNDCVTQSMTAATMTVSKYLKENPVECVHYAAKVTTENGKTSITTCRMVDMDFTTMAITTMDFPICDSSFGEYENSIKVENPDQLPDWGADAQNQGNSDPDEKTEADIYCVADEGDPALVAIEFDVCPDPVLVLGSAFGWVAMLELAATLVVLAICMPTGHLKNDQSFLKTMIATVNAEKETVQSGGIEMASTMIDVEI